MPTLQKSHVPLVKHRHAHEDRHWLKSALPFFANPRGKLIHRVKSVTVYCNGETFSHYHVDYECGGGANAHDLNDNSADPPKNRLLCELCEFKAIQRRQKPADELAGRHVHKGRMVPQQTCCEAKRRLN